MQSKEGAPSRERRACNASMANSLPSSANFVNARLSRIHAQAFGFFSTKTAVSAPLLKASIPMAPLPLKDQGNGSQGLPAEEY